MAHRLGCLVKTSIGTIPIKDPHPKQTTDDYILRTSLIVHPHVTFRIADRKRPQRVVIMELGKGIVEPTRVPLKSIGILLTRENGVPSPTIGNLVLRQRAF